MTNRATEIVLVLDKSGSMYGLTDDTIGGFNGFIKEQKKLDGAANVTTVLFSTDYQKLHDRIPLQDVSLLDRTQYRTGGGTALLDAIGRTIDELQDRLDETTTIENCPNVIFVIITDGAENQSRTYNKSKISKMIKHQERAHGWNFIFLGADMSSVSDMVSIGIEKSFAYENSAVGLRSVYDSLDAATASVRSTGTLSGDWADAISCVDTGATSDIDTSKFNGVKSDESNYTARGLSYED